MSSWHLVNGVYIILPISKLIVKINNEICMREQVSEASHNYSIEKKLCRISLSVGLEVGLNR